MGGQYDLCLGIEMILEYCFNFSSGECIYAEEYLKLEATFFTAFTPEHLPILRHFIVLCFSRTLATFFCTFDKQFSNSRNQYVL